jgi:hypothetical protein
VLWEWTKIFPKESSNLMALEPLRGKVSGKTKSAIEKK